MSSDQGAIAIGLLGGSFNPVHWGHLILAQDARELFHLQRVIFMPCARSPHKLHDPDLAPAADRLEMLRRSVRPLLWADVSDLEVQRGGISYTVETVETLRHAHPEWILHLIIGSDSLRDLPRWHQVERLLSLCRLAILARPGFEAESVMEDLPQRWSERLRDAIRVGHLIGISSTEIRQRTAAGLEVNLLMPREAAEYLAQRGLYSKREGTE